MHEWSDVGLTRSTETPAWRPEGPRLQTAHAALFSAPLSRTRGFAGQGQGLRKEARQLGAGRQLPGLANSL